MTNDGDRRALSSGVGQPPGLIVSRVRARLLRDIGRSEDNTEAGVTRHPRKYPSFGPAEAWIADARYDEVVDANPADIFPITAITTGPNATLTITSLASDIFLKHDLLRITGSSGVAGAADGINDRCGHCLEDYDPVTGIISTNLNLAAAANLGNVIRLVPRPRKISRLIIQVVNRWHDADLTEGMIVEAEQEDGSEWYDVVSASCGPFDDQNEDEP